MDEPKSLDSLFNEKIFRIPDFQRGYAWGTSQLKDFWEDLINLPMGRSHYMGLLTLKALQSSEIEPSSKEYWLVEDHSYGVYHVIDGQQRLTTFIIFLQALVNFVKSLPEFADLSPDKIYLSESLSISEMTAKFLFRVKPTGDHFRTYKFGYTVDNPSYEYLRYKIFDEQGAGSIQETFYTLNLRNALNYFQKQLEELYQKKSVDGLTSLYKTVTKNLLFNEYVIKDEFDVFVAFETMNNRGKKLSDLELLKNRLIYLTTLFEDRELDKAERQSLREDINGAWKEVYYQLGRNEKHPLNDDDFLRAHWMLFYKYSRETGRDYARYLLGEQFTPQRVHKMVERKVSLEVPEEQRTDFDFDQSDSENGDTGPDYFPIHPALLKPTDIGDYVRSLKGSAEHWFNSYYPNLAGNMLEDERQSLDRLNRLGMGYFRPLVMAILKNVEEEEDRVYIFDSIERFIFLCFRMTSARSNYGSSDFSIAARKIDKGEIGISDIDENLNWRLSFLLDEKGVLNIDEFHTFLAKKFQAELGFYGWSGLRYFLYEYEQSLFSKSRQRKVEWEDLLKSPSDKISIEHIFPQTNTPYWLKAFASVPRKSHVRCQGSLGNLLLLSRSINSTLQNDSFDEKKNPKYDVAKRKVRNGYSDGSHSEIEVSQLASFGPSELRERGLKLLDFMAERWGFAFRNDDEKESLLFLP